MQFLTDTNIDFMKYRKVLVWVSITLILVACAELFFFTGLKLGIDFAGGTQITIKLRDAVDVDQLRRVFEDAGMREAQIQRYGTVESREVLIKAPVLGLSEEGSSVELIDTMNRELNGSNAGRFDLNQRGSEALATELLSMDPDGQRLLDEDAAAAHYQRVAQAVLDSRHRLGMFTDFGQISALAEVSDEAAEALEDRAYLGAFHVLQNEHVGPQIGSELRTKGVLSVVLSLLGMLMYIWYRFELRFGIGALVATFHDFLITLGLYAMAGYEFNLSTIAAFLTLVGYSVNDTVVIFDRVRENRRRHPRQPLVDVMNLSVNQTLSRTILTSGTTLLVVGSLFLLGGEVIRGFAFVLLIGVFVGTYSSVFVANPFALLWEQLFGQDAKIARTNR